jgi:hypothetical protein
MQQSSFYPTDVKQWLLSAIRKVNNLTFWYQIEADVGVCICSASYLPNLYKVFSFLYNLYFCNCCILGSLYLANSQKITRIT